MLTIRIPLGWHKKLDQINLPISLADNIDVPFFKEDAAIDKRSIQKIKITIRQSQSRDLDQCRRFPLGTYPYLFETGLNMVHLQLVSRPTGMYLNRHASPKIIKSRHQTG